MKGMQGKKRQIWDRDLSPWAQQKTQGVQTRKVVVAGAGVAWKGISLSIGRCNSQITVSSWASSLSLSFPHV